MATSRPWVEGASDVIEATCTTGSDHRYRHRIGDGPGQGKVVTRLGPVTVHRCEQDLTGSKLGHLTRPGHRTVSLPRDRLATQEQKSSEW